MVILAPNPRYLPEKEIAPVSKRFDKSGLGGITFRRGYAFITQGKDLPSESVAIVSRRSQCTAWLQASIINFGEK